MQIDKLVPPQHRHAAIAMVLGEGGLVVLSCCCGGSFPLLSRNIRPAPEPTPIPTKLKDLPIEIFAGPEDDPFEYLPRSATTCWRTG